MYKKLLLAALVASMAMLAGCAASQNEEPTEDESIGSNDVIQITGPIEGEGTHRFIDHDAETVCYVYKEWGGYAGAGGISCMPLNETALGR